MFDVTTRMYRVQHTCSTLMVVILVTLRCYIFFLDHDSWIILHGKNVTHTEMFDQLRRDFVAVGPHRRVFTPVDYVYTTLQQTATHCNALQHTATHCKTLQHTAKHCNVAHTEMFDQLRRDFVAVGSHGLIFPPIDCLFEPNGINRHLSHFEYMFTKSTVHVTNGLHQYCTVFDPTRLVFKTIRVLCIFKKYPPNSPNQQNEPHVSPPDVYVKKSKTNRHSLHFHETTSISNPHLHFHHFSCLRLYIYIYNIFQMCISNSNKAMVIQSIFTKQPLYPMHIFISTTFHSSTVDLFISLTFFCHIYHIFQITATVLQIRNSHM